MFLKQLLIIILFLAVSGLLAQEPLKQLVIDGDYTSSIDFSADNMFLAVGIDYDNDERDETCYVYIYSIPSGEIVTTLDIPVNQATGYNSVPHLEYTKDGKYLFIYRDYIFYLFDAKTYALVHEENLGDWIRSYKITKDGKKLFFVSHEWSFDKAVDRFNLFNMETLEVDTTFHTITKEDLKKNWSAEIYITEILNSANLVFIRSFAESHLPAPNDSYEYTEVYKINDLTKVENCKYRIDADYSNTNKYYRIDQSTKQDMKELCSIYDSETNESVFFLDSTNWFYDLIYSSEDDFMIESGRDYNIYVYSTKNWSLVETIRDMKAGKLVISDNNQWLIAYGMNLLYLYQLTNTGIDEPLINNTVITKIYPNPCNNIMSVELDCTTAGKAYLEIFDMKSTVISAQDLGYFNRGINVVTVNTAAISTGVYLLRVIVDGVSYSSKCIIN